MFLKDFVCKLLAETYLIYEKYLLFILFVDLNLIRKVCSANVTLSFMHNHLSS